LTAALDLTFGKLPAKRDGRTLKALDYALDLTTPASYLLRRQDLYQPIRQGRWPLATLAAAAALGQRFHFAVVHHVVVVRYNKRGEPLDLLQSYQKLRQPGGGAYVLDTLKLWQREGIWLGKDPRFRHGLLAYAAVRPILPDLRRAIYCYKVAYLGVAVTDVLLAAAAGETVDTNRHERRLGAHAFAVVGYDYDGLYCAPGWPGYKSHHLAWSYIGRHADEAYAVVDRRNSLGAKVDLARLVADVRRVRGEGGPA